MTNLQRQVLFTEDDAKNGAPKATAAADRLRAINSEIDIRPIVDDFNAGNAERYAQGADVLLDGLDNFETRYLLNDLAVAKSIPYMYGGAVGTTGMALAILPGDGPCLRCIFPDPPPAGSTATCDTAGVLATAIATTTAHQTTQTIKLLVGDVDAIDRRMLSFDLWANQTNYFDVSNGRDAQCVCCGQHKYEYLHGEHGGRAATLCGRNAVQVSPSQQNGELDLASIATKLDAHGEFVAHDALLRGVFSTERGDEDSEIELTLFPNGRAIIKGVSRPEAARSLYAKYIGS